MDAEWEAAVGSVAEETAKLLAALGSMPVNEGSSPEPDPAPEEHQHVPMGSAETCTWCPVCRGVVYLRELSPDTLRSLADVAALAATTLSDLATRRATAVQEPSTDEQTTHRPRPRRQSSTVEEVPITSADGAS